MIGLRALLALGVLSAASAAPVAAFADGENACGNITTGTLAIPGVEIAGAAEKDAADGLPRHCLVSGAVDKRVGADGRSYAIRFEMRLPDAWNGRFLHQVNGGNDGAVVPALGDRPEGLIEGGVTPLAQGFAVLSSDSGHSGADPDNKPLGLAAGAAFGLDPQARRDYGYSADIRLSPIAKAIIAARYGRKPDRSYMAGCSNGGRHTMVAAVRMPENYDGYLVGDPGFDLPRAAIQHAWDAQAFVKADSDIRKSITIEDARLVSQKIVEACDALDGAQDGLVSNLAACQKAFSFDSLTCRDGASGQCLPAAKVEALKASFAGPHDSKGAALYADWPVDGGVGLGNWRMWKVESPVAPWSHYPIIATMGAASLEYIFTTPPTRVEGTNDALMRALLSFDFDRDAPKIFATAAPFTESAMDFMTPPGVDDPRLPAFRDGARKMILYHGQADPVFSLNDMIRWYERLDRNAQGKARDFARLFAIPGYTHCGGGLALEKFDALGALVDWVEKGRAPERIVATVNPANKEIPASWSATRTRPLCPWPQFAKYNGGDVESAASFVCAAP
ncbi:MAG: tannase/feruloyl esterase family alpha/beta hydrolase [Hyphomicrobiales bacterium]|nr:tannase/feruloyl esterase family alpha/beta hydrolase [Hyphomicrobiales bacterium]